MPSLRRHAYAYNNLICFSGSLRKIKALCGHIATLGDTTFTELKSWLSTLEPICLHEFKIGLDIL
jgi:hypothetical protein